MRRSQTPDPPIAASSGAWAEEETSDGRYARGKSCVRASLATGRCFRFRQRRALRGLGGAGASFRRVGSRMRSRRALELRWSAGFVARTAEPKRTNRYAGGSPWRRVYYGSRDGVGEIARNAQAERLAMTARLRSNASNGCSGTPCAPGKYNIVLLKMGVPVMCQKAEAPSLCWLVSANTPLGARWFRYYRLWDVWPGPRSWIFVFVKF